MKFNLYFDMDNAAFEEDKEIETSLILHNVADTISKRGLPSDGVPYLVKDSNGNSIGKWGVTDSAG